MKQSRNTQRQVNANKRIPRLSSIDSLHDLTHTHCCVFTTAITSTSLRTTSRYFAVAVHRDFQGNGFLPSARELYTSTGSASMSEILDGWKWAPRTGLPARILQWQTCHGIVWLRVFIPVDSYSSQSTPRWATWRRGFRCGRIGSKR